MGSCYDTAVNCLENSYFCNQPYYENIMRQQCARTCQFCREASSDFDSATCRDVNPECRVWSQRGFCESLFYPEHVKQRYCALSCGYCRQQQQQQQQPPMEEPRPREPFADQPTPKTHEHTHKVHKTTPSGLDKDEEFVSTTTSEPVLSKENEEKSSEKKDKEKKTKNDE